MQITLTINDTEAEAELYDHPVAAELAQRLPLEMVFNEFNSAEKVAVLDRPLTLRGVPDAATWTHWGTSRTGHASTFTTA